MWTLFVAFCAMTPSGPSCASFAAPIFFPSREVCARAVPAIEAAIRADAVGMGAQVYFFDGRCADAKQGVAL